jgi:hypothetical protein
LSVNLLKDIQEEIEQEELRLKTPEVVKEVSFDAQILESSLVEGGTELDSLI